MATLFSLIVISFHLYYVCHLKTYSVFIVFSGEREEGKWGGGQKRKNRAKKVKEKEDK